ncbi:MAG: helix-turn-helix transcriptional regulator [Methylobacteriaceae bacterium]|nr:helix-turn-helix transcriptional regulator [Methylobacteriaceae bacterium]
MIDLGTIDAAQADGSPPSQLISGASPGESGVTISRVYYQRSAHFKASLRAHIVCFSSPCRIHCRAAGEAVTHDAPPGSIAVLPAGLDCTADTERDVESTYLIIDPARLSLVAAEDSLLKAELTGRLYSWDPSLAALARSLAEEARTGFPQGVVFWHETVGQFLAGLVARHMCGAKVDAGGVLDAYSLSRIRAHIMAHLDEPLDVATLAAMCGRSQYHFSRIFTRTVGVSPYRYVLHLRLKHAFDLIRNGSIPLAEIAYSAGFADQSHLTRWIRRAYGVTPATVSR